MKDRRGKNLRRKGKRQRSGRNKRESDVKNMEKKQEGDKEINEKNELVYF